MRAQYTHRAWPVAAALGVGLPLALSATPAGAEPQISVRSTVGYAARDLKDDPRGAFALGARGDVLFFRTRNRDTAIGPYVEGLTLAFHDVALGGGVAWLVPGLDEPAIVLSAGGFARRTTAWGWQPGVSGEVFVGFREHNFSSAYGMANGLFVQGRLGVGDDRLAAIVGGVQIDLALFTLPFLLAWGSVH